MFALFLLMLLGVAIRLVILKPEPKDTIDLRFNNTVDHVVINTKTNEMQPYSIQNARINGNDMYMILDAMNYPREFPEGRKYAATWPKLGSVTIVLVGGTNVNVDYYWSGKQPLVYRINNKFYMRNSRDYLIDHIKLYDIKERYIDEGFAFSFLLNKLSTKNSEIHAKENAPTTKPAR